MVDPNRKINHLTDEDVKYLNECENEFKDRFTENDEEFKALCDKPISDPPIVTNWMVHRSGNAGSSNYRGNRSGNYNQRPYHNRSNRGGGGGHHHHNRNYNNEGGDYRQGTKRPYNYNGGNNNAGNYNKRDEY